MFKVVCCRIVVWGKWVKVICFKIVVCRKGLRAVMSVTNSFVWMQFSPEKPLLTHSTNSFPHTTNLKPTNLKMSNLKKRKISIIVGKTTETKLKILLQKETLLVLSNISFWYNVFKSRLAAADALKCVCEWKGFRAVMPVSSLFVQMTFSPEISLLTLYTKNPFLRDTTLIY